MTNIRRLIDNTMLALIGITCFLYSIFASNFAEKHIVLNFLNFPIFVGEVLLLACLIALAFRWILTKFQWKVWYVLFLVYAGWVLLKAISGYIHYGPLSFRNAALFYYSVFFIFGYVFFQQRMLSERLVNLLLVLTALMLGAKVMNAYFWFYYYIFFIILLLRTKNSWFKVIGWILALLFFNLDILFGVSRSHLVGITLSFLFICIFSIGCFLNLKVWKKLLILIFLLICFTAGMAIFADKNAVKSVVTYEELSQILNEYDQIIKERGKDYLPQKLAVNIYNKNSNSEDVFNIMTSNKLDDGRGHSGKVQVKERYRSLGKAYNNIVFRLYIWRDMVDELNVSTAIFGVSFGKPQRSQSIEILNWATGEWQRDGWITPHNSFLHMIYRGGIIGLVFILSMICVFCYMTVCFYRNKSLIGCLLVAVLLYCVAIANFLVVLELPYHAIPFWALFGVIFAYCQRLSTAPITEEQKNNE